MPVASVRAPIERWSRSELEDRFHSVFDEVQTLKQNNQQMKREMKIINGRIGAGRGRADTQRDGPEREAMMDELQRSNQVLSQKLQVLKHQLLNYTALNSRRHPGGVGSRPSTGQPKAGTSRGQSKGQNRQQGGPLPSPSTGKRPQSAALMGTFGGKNGRNQPKRIGGQRAVPASAGTTRENGANREEPNSMGPSEFSPERPQRIVENGGSRVGRQKSNDWMEIVQQPLPKPERQFSVQSAGGVGFNEQFGEMADGRMRDLQRQNRMALAENEELRLSLEKNEQRLATLRREYDRIAAELEETRRELRAQSDSLSSYREEAQRKTETSTKSAEISDKELAILREECRSLKAAYDRLVTRSLEEENGSKTALEELARLRTQIQKSSSENESERREWEGMVEKLRVENGRMERELKMIEMGRHNREPLKNGFGGENGGNAEENRAKMQRNGNFEGNRQNGKTQNPSGNLHQLPNNLGQTNGEAMLDKLFNDVMGIVNSHIGQRNGKIGEIDSNDQNRWQKMYEDVYEELEKVRRLLLSEHGINAGMKEQIEQMALENENLRQKYAQDLADLRGEFEARGIRMGHLERELEEVAASGQIREAFLANGGKSSIKAGIESTELSLHISKFSMTKFALEQFVGESSQFGPIIFVAIEFFDFELQTSQLANGPEADLNFNAVFELGVSDLFIHYLQTEGINVELYIVRDGPSYELLSQAQIPLHKLLSTQTPTQFRGELRFPMLSNGDQPSAGKPPILGTLAYSVQVPFALLRALSAQRRRMAASALLPIGGGNEGQNDELTIQIHRCNGLDKLKGGGDNGMLQAREGQSSSADGGTYVAYEFFNFPVHMSKTVNNALGNPVFDDNHSWKLPMGSEAVHKFLMEKDLLVYVIQKSPAAGSKLTSDSQSPNSRALGFIRIPLFPLSRNGKISGTFPLCDRADDSIAAGTSIDISIYWKFAYLFQAQRNSELEQIKFAAPLTKNVAIPLDKEKQNVEKRTVQENLPIKNESFEKLAPIAFELAAEKPKSLDESEDEEEMSEAELRRRLFAGLEESKQNVDKLEGEYSELKKAVELGNGRQMEENLGEKRDETNVEEYAADFEEFEPGKEKLEAEMEKAAEGKNSTSDSQISVPDKIESPKSSSSSEGQQIEENEAVEGEGEEEEDDDEGSIKSNATYTMETRGEGGGGEGEEERMEEVVIRDEDIRAKEELRKAVREVEEEERNANAKKANKMEEVEKPPVKPEPAIRRSLLGELPPIQHRRQIRIEPESSTEESSQETAVNNKEASSGRKTVEFTEPLHSSIPPSDVSASFSEDLLSSRSNASGESNENGGSGGSSPNSQEDSSMPRNVEKEAANEGENGQIGGEKQQRRKQRRLRKSKQRRQINIDAVPKSSAIRAHPREESFESVTSNGETQQNGQQGNRAIVLIRVGKLRLLEHSSLLHPEFDDAQVYVEWNFLDIEREFCETEGTMPLPRHSSEHVEFDQQKAYELNHKRVALLKQWTELNIRLTFTLVLEPASERQQESDDLCMGELDLMEVLNASGHTLIMRNVDNMAIAVLEVEVEYSSRLMQEIRDAIDAADDGIVEV